MLLPISENILFKTLNQGQVCIVEQCIDFLTNSLWREDRLIRHFTEHGYNHAVRVLNNIALLITNVSSRRVESKFNSKFNLKSDLKLSNDEVYLLVLSALFHDIGMQCDLRMYPEVKILAENTFNAVFDSEFNKETDLTVQNMQDLRKNHHILTVAWLLNSYRDKLDTPLGRVVKRFDQRLLADLRRICQYHSKEKINDCKESGNTPNVRTRYLAALLRLGDELDIEKSRVNVDAIRIFSYKAESGLYWHLHDRTNVSISTNKICIKVGLSNNDFNAHNALFLSYLESLHDKNEPILRVLRENDLNYDFDRCDDCIVCIDEYDDIPDNVIEAIRSLTHVVEDEDEGSEQAFISDIVNYQRAFRDTDPVFGRVYADNQGDD